MSFPAMLRGTMATLALALTSTAAPAAMIAALHDGNKISWIDTDQKKTTGSVQLADNAKLVGMDVRPADGKLYGLTADGVIVVVDHKTGKWEKKSQLSEKLPAGAEVTVDFNPVADRMRILTSGGMSLRVNVDDGKAVVDGSLKFAEADASKGKTPKVTAGAYTNSHTGAKETALYDIDMTSGTLVMQAPPNEGVLKTIGKLGVTLSGPIAFDIVSDGKGGNSAWLMAGNALHSVDLTSGAAKVVAPIAGLSGQINDIAVLPAN